MSACCRPLPLRSETACSNWRREARRTRRTRADNLRRFMAGVHIGWAPLFAWAAATIRRQVVLVYPLAVPIFLGDVGRLVSFAQDAMPSPAGGVLTSALLELLLPIVIVRKHSTALRSRRVPTAA
ncbi:DUF4345 family protein [Streptomyces sp. NBC_01615]|uniref:DUF4345 family protein n=1 Tax=Streptomyces sp. NBC_01615 TaxID=2975898 RepID=UPI00386C8129